MHADPPPYEAFIQTDQGVTIPGTNTQLGGCDSASDVTNCVDYNDVGAPQTGGFQNPLEVGFRVLGLPIYFRP